MDSEVCHGGVFHAHFRGPASAGLDGWIVSFMTVGYPAGTQLMPSALLPLLSVVLTVGTVAFLALGGRAPRHKA